MRLARKFCTASTWELLAIYKNYIMEKEFYETAVHVTVPSPFFRTLSCSWLILFRTRRKSYRVRKNGKEWPLRKKFFLHCTVWFYWCIQIYGNIYKIMGLQFHPFLKKHRSELWFYLNSIKILDRQHELRLNLVGHVSVIHR